MKKILIMDYIFPKGHVALNNNICQLISKIKDLDIDVINSDNYIKVFPNVNYLEFNLKKKNNGLIGKINQILNITTIYKKIQKNSYDIVWFNTFDTITFYFARILFRKYKKIFIVYHKNTNELKNKVKSYFFSRYKNKVNHIVFEEFIKEYLVDKNYVNNKLVSVVPHPISLKGRILKEEIINKPDTKLLTGCGLSNSNSKDLVENIVIKERESKFLEKNGFSLWIKYPYNICNDTKSINLIKYQLSDEQYIDIIEKSDFTFMPFSKDYIYRVSGYLLDALTRAKPVIGTGAEIINKYSELYPNLVYQYSSFEDLIEIVQKIGNSRKIYLDYMKFINRHSDDNILITLASILENK